ncbi:MAG: hypothetical protein ACF8NJ_00830 [Phycisphaerales bacterium JB038]
MFRDYGQGVIDYQEIEDIMGCSYNQARKYVQGEAEPRAPECEAWSIYRATRGDLRYARCFVPSDTDLITRVIGQADGNSEDEIRDLVKAASGFDDGHRESDIRKMDEAMRLIKEIIIPNMEAERALIASEMT